MADFKKIFDDILDTEDTTDTFEPNDIKENGVISALSYLLFFIPLIAKPESDFGKYHANQGLLCHITVILAEIVSVIIGKILHSIPFIGWMFANLFGTAISISLVALVLVGVFNALKGKAKELPFVGKFKIIK